MSKFGNLIKSVAKGGFSPFAWLASVAKHLFGSKIEVPTLMGAATSYVNAKTGAGLTGAQIAQNDWNAQQAQEQRSWEEQMDNTKYQRQTADMQAAGLNPAMMYGQGYTASTPSGSAASGSPEALSAGMVDDIMNVMFAKQRMANLKGEGAVLASQANKNNAEADAARRNATTGERQATVAETRAQIERDLADSNIELNSGKLDQLASVSAYVKELKEYVSKNYEVAMKNADSLQKQAIAAIRQADASVQNASTNSYLADYQTDLLYSNTLLNDIIKGEHQVLYDALPERTRLEVDNLRKQGVIMDKQGWLIDKQGNLVTAQTVKSYVNCATDVLNAVANIAGSGLSLSSPAPIGFGKR